MFCGKKFLRTVITEIFTEFYFCGLTNFYATGNKRKLAKFYWDKRLMLQLSWMKLLEHLKKNADASESLKSGKTANYFLWKYFLRNFSLREFFCDLAKNLRKLKTKFLQNVLLTRYVKIIWGMSAYFIDVLFLVLDTPLSAWMRKHVHIVLSCLIISSMCSSQTDGW